MRTEVLLTGVVFPESPRWHDGKLWFSDVFGRRVVTVDARGDHRVIAEFDENPSGLGFLPDGTPLVVLMGRLSKHRQVVWLRDGGYGTHADLTAIPGSHLNDMVVDASGRAYVGNIVRPDLGEGYSCLILVEPDGRFRIASPAIEPPNGLVITEDRRTLVAAQTFARQLIALTVEADGSLRDPRIFASTGDVLRPDGICGDAAGAVWVAGLETGEFVRVLPGGQIANRLSVGKRWAVACVLGGDDRRTLYMATAEVTQEQLTQYASGANGGAHGFIEAATVDVPGAGWP